MNSANFSLYAVRDCLCTRINAGNCPGSNDGTCGHDKSRQGESRYVLQLNVRLDRKYKGGLQIFVCCLTNQSLELGEIRWVQHLMSQVIRVFDVHHQYELLEPRSVLRAHA